MDSRNTDLLERLSTGDEKARLKAALEAGSDPDPGMVEVLVERCAVEPNFFVRDMLTWALTRLPGACLETWDELVADSTHGSMAQYPVLDVP